MSEMRRAERRLFTTSTSSSEMMLPHTSKAATTLPKGY